MRSYLYAGASGAMIAYAWFTGDAMERIDIAQWIMLAAIWTQQQERAK